MPVTITDLPEQDVGDVDDADLWLVYDPAAPSNKTKKVTRANALNDVVREGGDHDLGTSEIAHLTAAVDAFTFDSTAVLTDMFKAEGSVTLSALAGGASETKTFTMAGVATTDYLLGLAFTASIEDGIIARGWISSANTISVRFTNTKAGAATGATYTVRAVAMRFA